LCGHLLWTAPNVNNFFRDNIGFKRHIIEDCVPELPDYKQVMQASQENAPCNNTRTKTSSTSMPLRTKSAETDDDKPCCSKTLPFQQISIETSTKTPSKGENEADESTSSATILSMIEDVQKRIFPSTTVVEEAENESHPSKLSKETLEEESTMPPNSGDRNISERISLSKGENEADNGASKTTLSSLLIKEVGEFASPEAEDKEANKRRSSTKHPSSMEAEGESTMPLNDGDKKSYVSSLSESTCNPEGTQTHNEATSAKDEKEFYFVEGP